jgi:hypothetical protein
MRLKKQQPATPEPSEQMVTIAMSELTQMIARLIELEVTVEIREQLERHMREINAS